MKIITQTTIMVIARITIVTRIIVIMINDKNYNDYNNINDNDKGISTTIPYDAYKPQLLHRKLRPSEQPCIVSAEISLPRRYFFLFSRNQLAISLNDAIIAKRK